MKIEFEYYKYNEHYGPHGFMSIDLHNILYTVGGKNINVFPINNLKKIFKVLHEMTDYEVHTRHEQNIAYYLDSEYKKMKAKKYRSKNDEKIIKRMESIHSAFVKSCKWNV